MATAQVAKDIITLKGSAQIVTEFFGYAVNSIIFQRGLYPIEQFNKVKKYGVTLFILHEERVKDYISSVTSQLSAWLETGKLQRVVLVIQKRATLEPLERWNFDIEIDKEVVEKRVSRQKSDKDIMKEIQAIMRQITCCETFLPCLDEPCMFDLLAYTDKDATVPISWTDSDPLLIAKPRAVKLHSFDTKVHRVDTLVSYKMESDD